MIIAYLMNSETSIRDGLGYLSVAPTEPEAIAKLKATFESSQRELDDETPTTIEWHEDQYERPRAIVKWTSPDGAEQSDVYWLHTAECE